MTGPLCIVADGSHLHLKLLQLATGCGLEYFRAHRLCLCRCQLLLELGDHGVKVTVSLHEAFLLLLQLLDVVAGKDLGSLRDLALGLLLGLRLHFTAFSSSMALAFARRSW